MLSETPVLPELPPRRVDVRGVAVHESSGAKPFTYEAGVKGTVTGVEPVNVRRRLKTMLLMGQT